MINAFRMNLGVKSFFLFFFFLRIQPRFVVDADGSDQETVLSRFRVTFVFFFFIGNCDSFSCFFIYSGQK